MNGSSDSGAAAILQAMARGEAEGADGRQAAAASTRPPARKTPQRRVSALDLLIWQLLLRRLARRRGFRRR